MESCLICCRASEGAELYSLNSGKLIQTLARQSPNPISPTTNSQSTSLIPAINQSSPVLARISPNPTRSGLSLTALNSQLSTTKLIPPVPLTAISTSSGGSYIAGGTQDGSILVWELESGTLLATIDAHYQAITTLSFTKDEGALVAGSKDGAITVWPIKT